MLAICENCSKQATCDIPETEKIKVPVKMTPPFEWKPGCNKFKPV